MPRTPEQLDHLREQSRERILRSALALFARHGFARTSVRMLAQDAGISQGLLYNYFSGKEAVLRAIFERSMDQVQQSFAEASRAPSPERALERLVRSAFAVVRANEDFWRLSYQLRMQPEVLAGLGDEVGDWSGRIRAHLEALLRDAGSPDPEVRARLLFAAIDGAAQHYVLEPGRYPLDRVADELVRLLSPPPDPEAET